MQSNNGGNSSNRNRETKSSNEIKIQDRNTRSENEIENRNQTRITIEALIDLSSDTMTVYEMCSKAEKETKEKCSLKKTN